jgi:hypothetical protein
MYLGFMEYIEPLYSRFANGEIPHVKQRLRQYYSKFKGLEATDKIMVNRLDAEIKNEIAKSGQPVMKAPRLYVGYGAGSMYANELPEFVKMSLSQSFYFHEKCDFGMCDFHIYLMTKPRQKEIEEVFNRISFGLPTNTHVIVIYSDDSVWAGNDRGVPYAFNCDISSCDASVKSAGFFMTGIEIAQFDVERAVGLIQQCKLPINVRSRSEKDKNIKIRRHRNDKEGGVKIVPIEGSGTVLTTINNFNIMLMTALMYIKGQAYGVRQSILESGLLCGLNLEISYNFEAQPEKLQFLKYSPILCTDGKYHMVRNLGCVLRGFGKVDGDLSNRQLGVDSTVFASMKWCERMDRYCSSVTKSYCHEPSSLVLDSLRERFSVPTDLTVESTSLIINDNENFVVVEESLARRYNISTQELSQLAEKIKRVKIGDVVVDDSLTQIYYTDYGL